MSGERTPDQIIQRPVISEKSYAEMGNGRYVFRCFPRATKLEIKRAIEDFYSAKGIVVLAVNTLRVRGKERSRSRARGRQRIMGRSPGWKKAIVTLAPGQKIEDIFENV